MLRAPTDAIEDEGPRASARRIPLGIYLGIPQPLAIDVYSLRLTLSGSNGQRAIACNVRVGEVRSRRGERLCRERAGQELDWVGWMGEFFLCLAFCHHALLSIPSTPPRRLWLPG